MLSGFLMGKYQVTQEYEAVMGKGREDGKSCMKSVYTALAVNFEGGKEVLGLWIAKNEGASDFSPRSGWPY